MFKDEAEIYVKAGDGGKGCIAFRREKFMPRGGPSGGDGGKGGDVIIKAANNCNTLLHLAHKTHYTAENGENGLGKDCYGKAAPPVIIEVPPGTLIKDENQRILVDLEKDGQEVVIARGGKGGLGNIHFANSVNQAPRYAQPGEQGEKRHIFLELKLIADVALVGFPNAGKSTLISRISAARPKIAAYPFTTLEPNLGIVQLQDYRTLVVADIPGILEGAHQGVGLGDKFLKHIERTRVLIFLIDIAPIDNTDPLQTLEVLKKELSNYSETLAKKEYVIAANKMDLTDAQSNFERFAKAVDRPVYPISGVTGKGIQDLIKAVVDLMDKINNPVP
ncbi:MAG: GTPase ObgE [Candidatus Brocadiae bacterium]|nr:GTPase ObgE [Candidatus Brocadiia bacterium]